VEKIERELITAVGLERGIKAEGEENMQRGVKYKEPQVVVIENNDSAFPINLKRTSVNRKHCPPKSSILRQVPGGPEGAHSVQDPKKKEPRIQESFLACRRKRVKTAISSINHISGAIRKGWDGEASKKIQVSIRQLEERGGWNREVSDKPRTISVLTRQEESGEEAGSYRLGAAE